jgi:hypothetical protein
MWCNSIITEYLHHFAGNEGERIPAMRIQSPAEPEPNDVCALRNWARPSHLQGIGVAPRTVAFRARVVGREHSVKRLGSGTRTGIECEEEFGSIWLTRTQHSLMPGSWKT